MATSIIDNSLIPRITFTPQDYSFAIDGVKTDLTEFSLIFEPFYWGEFDQLNPPAIKFCIFGLGEDAYCIAVPEDQIDKMLPYNTEFWLKHLADNFNDIIEDSIFLACPKNGLLDKESKSYREEVYLHYLD